MGGRSEMKIEWLEPAKRRVGAIFDYHNSVAGERTARRIVQKLVKKTRILVRHPQAGQCEWLLEDQPEEFRRLVEGNYKIIYYTEGEIVKIADIWDCRRDPESLRERAIND